jgi:hypothetical protein
MKYKVGDKLVPHSKSIATPFNKEPNWIAAKERRQPYLFVVRVHEKEKYYSLSDLSNDIMGNHYLESDLTLYEEPIKSIPRYDLGNNTDDHIVPPRSPFWHFNTLPQSKTNEEYTNNFNNLMKQEKVKPQTFSIIGSPKQLEAMEEALKEIGYTNWIKPVDPFDNRAYSNTICLNGDFHSINPDMYYSKMGPVLRNKNFNLPQDFNPALDFAKQQLAIAKKYFKKELEYTEGEWLYNTFGDGLESLFRFKSLDNGVYSTLESYFLHNNKYSLESLDILKYINSKNVQPATKEQIERILSVVAVHKGFVEGVMYDSLSYKTREVLKKGEIKTHNRFIYRVDIDSLGCNYEYGWIYVRGQWAEIVKDELPLLQVSNYTGQYGESGVQFGSCTFISKDIFIDASKLLTNLKSVSESVNPALVINGTTISTEDIHKIAKHYTI